MKKHALDLNKLARTTNVFYELSPEESKNLKSCLYSMFVDIKRICDKHNLILMLSGGWEPLDIKDLFLGTMILI